MILSACVANCTGFLCLFACMFGWWVSARALAETWAYHKSFDCIDVAVWIAFNPTFLGPAYHSFALSTMRRTPPSCIFQGPWLGGSSKVTIADLCVFDLVDAHLAAAELAKVVKERFPALVAHHKRVVNQPGACACVHGV